MLSNSLPLRSIVGDRTTSAPTTTPTGGSTSIARRPSAAEMAVRDASSFPIPANEPQRLDALHALDILDSAPEVAYDEIAELAAQICGCPVGYISFIDDDRRWLKARYGLPSEVTNAPRGATVCSTTICGADVLVVPDMTQDPRFDRVGLVVGDPHCRFYCGVPLITDEGYALGTLCVMDFEPRRLTFEQTEALRRLSRQVLTLLELRRRLIEHDQMIRRLDQAHKEVAAQKARAEANSCTTFCQPQLPTSSRKTGACNQGTYALRQFYLRTFKALRSWPNERSPPRSLVFWTSI